MARPQKGLRQREGACCRVWDSVWEAEAVGRSGSGMARSGSTDGWSSSRVPGAEHGQAKRLNAAAGHGRGREGVGQKRYLARRRKRSRRKPGLHSEPEQKPPQEQTQFDGKNWLKIWPISLTGTVAAARLMLSPSKCAVRLAPAMTPAGGAPWPRPVPRNQFSLLPLSRLVCPFWKVPKGEPRKGAGMAEVLASASVTASALAFGGSSDVSFLAAGTAPGSSNPGLLIYRTAAAYVDGVLPLVARFPSPAAFCRVAWSRPTEASCYSSALPTGLIASGLESGVVAVWDPRMDCSRSTVPPPSLVAGGHDHGNRATAVSDPHSNDNLMLQSEDGRSESGNGRWFSQFRVLSLSFSPTTPHFLASGGAKGTVLIWDLINPSAKRIPHFRYTEDDNAQISDLSWNPLKPNVITSASNVGVKILDISAKSSVIGKFSSMETCSAVEWCPADKDTMVIASGNCCKVWDVRKVDKPLHQFSDTNSIVAISWCPFEKEIVLACTEEKLILLNVKKGEVVHEVKAPGKCLAVRWNQHRVNHFALATSQEENRATTKDVPWCG